VEVSLVPASFDRERHLPLLLEADDAEEHMRGYLDRGELLEIHDADGMIGVAVLVREADEVEIWNIALAEEHRGRGLGRAAIGAIADRCTRTGVSRLTVGTSDCSLGTIAFCRRRASGSPTFARAISMPTRWPWSRTASAPVTW
jgi:GNAT superfamily N-acetyltransferase